MIKILLIIVVLGLIQIFFILLKEKKKVWQKIYVIYNQIYIMLVDKLYETKYGRKLIMEELKDYVDKVLLSDTYVSLSYLNTLKKFIMEFVGSKVDPYFTKLDSYAVELNSLNTVLLLLFLSILVLLIAFIISFII